MKKVGTKQRAMIESNRGWRDDFMQEFGYCMVCGTGNQRGWYAKTQRDVLCVHEMVSGTGGRPRSYLFRELCLVVCWGCNGDVLKSMKLAEQLVHKILHDPFYFDLDAIREVKNNGRNPVVVTMGGHPPSKGENGTMNKHAGKLSIHRINSNMTEDYVTIELEDQTSGTRIVDIEMSLPEFASCLMGLGYVPCNFGLYGKDVGKRRELRSIVVPRPPIHGRKSKFDPTAWIKKHAGKELVDGWEIHNAGDCENSHKWCGDGVRVGLIRFVEPSAAENTNP